MFRQRDQFSGQSRNQSFRGSNTYEQRPLQHSGYNDDSYDNVTPQNERNWARQRRDSGQDPFAPAQTYKGGQNNDSFDNRRTPLQPGIIDRTYITSADQSRIDRGAAVRGSGGNQATSLRNPMDTSQRMPNNDSSYYQNNFEGFAEAIGDQGTGPRRRATANGTSQNDNTYANLANAMGTNGTGPRRITIGDSSQYKHDYAGLFEAIGGTGLSQTFNSGPSAGPSEYKDQSYINQSNPYKQRTGSSYQSNPYHFRTGSYAKSMKHTAGPSAAPEQRMLQQQDYDDILNNTPSAAAQSRTMKQREYDDILNNTNFIRSSQMNAQDEEFSRNTEAPAGLDKFLQTYDLESERVFEQRKELVDNYMQTLSNDFNNQQFVKPSLDMTKTNIDQPIFERDSEDPLEDSDAFGFTSQKDEPQIFEVTNLPKPPHSQDFKTKALNPGPFRKPSFQSQYEDDMEADKTGQRLEIGNQLIHDSIQQYQDQILVNVFNEDVDLVGGGQPVSLAARPVYTGMVLQNDRSVKQGYGSIKYPDGIQYEGLWDNNLYNGRGKLQHVKGTPTRTDAKIDVYEGEFVDGEAQGFGMSQHSNGTKYVGYWDQGKQSGFGHKIQKDGEEYLGFFKSSSKEGQGQQLFKKGNQYIGEWQNNQQNGTGFFSWKNSCLYIGEWKGNLMHGEGTQKWRNGSMYVGSYLDNEVNGQGFKLFSDGAAYNGQWQNGKQHGNGFCFEIDRNRYSEAEAGGNNLEIQKGLWINGEKREVYNDVISDKEIREQRQIFQEMLDWQIQVKNNFETVDQNTMAEVALQQLGKAEDEAEGSRPHERCSHPGKQCCLLDKLLSEALAYDKNQYLQNCKKKKPQKKVRIQESPSVTDRSETAEWRFILTTLFKVIATYEQEIELLREEMAKISDFDIKALFDIIDADEDGLVDAEEISRFLVDNDVGESTPQQCKAIITEYSKLNSFLQYNDFVNIFVPAANEDLRAEFLSSDKEQLPTQIRQLPKALSVATVILDKERQLALQKIQIKCDFYEKFGSSQIGKSFLEITGGRRRDFMEMEELQAFLASNGFIADEEDILAIRRRCDYERCKRISDTKFHELLDLPPGAREMTSPADRSLSSPIQIAPREVHPQQEPRQQASKSSERSRIPIGGFSDPAPAPRLLQTQRQPTLQHDHVHQAREPVPTYGPRKLHHSPMSVRYQPPPPTPAMLNQANPEQNIFKAEEHLKPFSRTQPIKLPQMQTILGEDRVNPLSRDQRECFGLPIRQALVSQLRGENPQTSKTNYLETPTYANFTRDQDGLYHRVPRVPQVRTAIPVYKDGEPFEYVGESEPRIEQEPPSTIHAPINYHETRTYDAPPAPTTDDLRQQSLARLHSNSPTLYSQYKASIQLQEEDLGQALAEAHALRNRSLSQNPQLAQINKEMNKNDINQQFSMNLDIQDANINSENDKSRLLRIQQLIEFLKDKYVSHNLDLLKSVVQNNQRFSLMDLFREMDPSNKGYVNPANLAAFFDAETDMKFCNYKQIIQYWNGSKVDQRLTIDELYKAFQVNSGKDQKSATILLNIKEGKNRIKTYSPRRGVEPGQGEDDGEHSQLYDENLRGQIQDIFLLTDLKAKREVSCSGFFMSSKDAKELWKELDVYDSSAISGELLQRWLQRVCRYTLGQNDPRFLLDAFGSEDRVEGLITEQQFVKGLSGADIRLEEFIASESYGTAKTTRENTGQSSEEDAAKPSPAGDPIDLDNLISSSWNQNGKRTTRGRAPGLSTRQKRDPLSLGMEMIGRNDILNLNSKSMVELRLANMGNLRMRKMS